MIPQRWKASLFALAGRTPVTAEKRTSVPSGVQLPLANATRASATVNTADVPVFDHRRRQVGFIRGPEPGTDESGLTPENRMSYCMNAPLSWLGRNGSGETVDIVCWRRIPLLDKDNQVCGIVVVEVGAARPRPALVPASATARTSH